MTKSNKRIEWESRISHWKASSLSKSKWCGENGIKLHQMYYWLQQIDGVKPTKSKSMETYTNFLPVDVTDESVGKTGSILIHIDRDSARC